MVNSHRTRGRLGLRRARLPGPHSPSVGVPLCATLHLVLHLSSVSCTRSLPISSSHRLSIFHGLWSLAGCDLRAPEVSLKGECVFQSADAPAALFSRPPDLLC